MGYLPNNDKDVTIVTTSDNPWLLCPCGQTVVGANEDDLVEKAKAHLAELHPDIAAEYEREHILFLAR